MFGASSSGGTGLFGGAQQKPAFGSSASTGNVNSGSGFSFGSSNNNTNTGNTGTSGGFGSLGGQSNTGSGPTAPSGGLFGSNTNTQNSQSTSNLFGQNKPAGGGLFGGSTSNTGTSGGLFGGSNTAPNQQSNTNTSGGLFGSGNTGNTSGGLFGKPPASSGGGLFGPSNTNTQSNATGNTLGSSGGGLFGSANTNTSSNTSGGLFGKSNTSAPASSGGLFGGSNTQQNTQSGGLFGQSNSAPTSQQNTNAGTNTGSSLFGGSTVNNAQPSFSWSSQQQQKPQQSGLLNLPNLSNSQASSQQAPSSSSSTYTPPINDQLIKLKEQWDPNSPKCALKTHFYNKFSQEEINALLQQPRPANESPEDWDSAMSERPTTQHYPIKITSFSDVSQRIETQLDHVAKSRILLNNINEKQTQLSSKHDLDNTTRILKAKARHTKLSRRLLRLATVLAILKLKGYPLLPEEEEISKQFQTLNARLSDPNGPVGKLSDLYARLAILKGRSEDLSSQLESSIGSIHGGLNDIMNGKEGSGVVGGTDSNNYIDQIVNQLTKLLYKQQVGLSYLNELLQKDLETVDKRLASQN
ncbi:hypothetical protein CA3LBN_004215 [Candidozyma haemuli]|uniref:Nucleoporin Nup54 alpha-helical domain-containing protein n=1 Tax=Candidozyma haemuli TaxID=45357 RepID=A0ABX8I9V6_9ASCO|nr:hypothetical protein CA3LBN_004215 [[Candida] haemuloni]